MIFLAPERRFGVRCVTSKQGLTLVMLYLSSQIKTKDVRSVYVRTGLDYECVCPCKKVVLCVRCMIVFAELPRLD